MTEGTAVPIPPSAAAKAPSVAWGPVSMASKGWLAQALTVEDLRQAARRALPRPIYDFVDGGGENELTLNRNCTAFDDIRFRPRGVASIADRTQTVSFLGRASAAPFGIGPMGGLGALCPDADLVSARIAARAGIPHVLASGARNSIEEVARAAPDARRWFQLYVFRDPELNRRLLERAAAAGCEALVVTTDTQINAKRTRDMRNGFTIPMKLKAKNVCHFAVRPRWLWTIARDPRSALMGNLVRELGEGATARQAFDFFRDGRSRSVGWEDLKRLRDIWRGPMLIKGIVTAEETARALELGADGVVVSNHGGRNLDGTVATIEALPEVVAAAKGRLAVLLDSGIRRGSDIVKAMALGAQAVLVARPVAFALAAAGEAGVEHVLAMLHDEIDRVQGLMGFTRFDQLDANFVKRERP